MSTTEVLAARGKKLAAGAGALSTALALGATLLVAAPAQAKPQPQPRPQPQTGPAKPYGTVTAARGMNERQDPSTDSAPRGYLRNRTQVGLVCKVRAQNIRGNDVWYLLREHRSTWVSAKHVTNTGYVKYCKDVQRNRVQPGDAAKYAG
ncbi:SH3 domain-containing protein [Streptomyces sp. RS10V-4]|uniref:SH3 domain-containing protein n=1 Tax=Streptomyces rhizoryzae TaxID=2932493 RepID=UPI0020039630|nr:SH3 domain-containing protein [Streptomyces rhizoryzae]MCK7624836.1 SH3 domain-containing protein [Streptomyces rhizoryzae]